MASHSQKYGYEDERFENAVSQNFHCSICLNVLKEPKMCRNNEHVFCSVCITQHLSNSSTCPECMEELTVETLRRAPRVLVNYLSELTINCDYFNRGCREFVRLEHLQAHVISCGFAPVSCSNNECGMEIDKKDRIHHETVLCDFRRVKCHDCGEMKKEMKEQLNKLQEMKEQLNQLPEMKDQLQEMKEQLNQLPEMKEQLNQLPEMKEQLNQLLEMNAQPSSLKEDMNDVRAMMVKVLHKIDNVEHASQVPLHVNTTKEDILIAGGIGKDGYSNSAETFSWNKRAWTPLPAMAERRQRASSFAYENQVFVAGGYTERMSDRSDRSDRMEVLKIDEQPLKWTESPAKLPYKCHDHKTVVYQNRLIHIGGYNKTEQKHSDTISEVLLTPPYSKKMLCRMPQGKSHHGAEIFNDKIMILGGTTSFLSKDSVNSVLEYDVNKNECKQMPPLPRAVWGMATVRRGDKVIVMGGVDKEGKVLSDVLMYDCKTGESNVLPSMKHKRCGCTAIITRNVIVVMGGSNKKDNCFSSVECFTLGGNSWEELPPMIEPRHFATAVVMPSTL